MRVLSSESTKVIFKWKGWERCFEEEYLLEEAKRRSNAYPITQSDLPRNSTARGEHYEHIGRTGTRKYLR